MAVFISSHFGDFEDIPQLKLLMPGGNKKVTFT